MLGRRTEQRTIQKAAGAGLSAGLCSVAWVGAAGPEGRVARCAGELGGVAVRGAVDIRSVATPEMDHIVGNFAGPQLSVELEACLQEGSGTGTLRYLAASPRMANVDVELRRGGVILRTRAGSKSLFTCNGG